MAGSLFARASGHGADGGTAIQSDWSLGNGTQLVRDALAYRLPATVRGGYDFVDVRDVASGIITAAERGEPGRTYLLTGEYHRITDVVRDAVAAAGRKWKRPELPRWLAKAIAPFVELNSTIRRVAPTFTAYSLRTLGSNARFDHSRATKELAYETRPWPDTVRDWVKWLDTRDQP